MISSKKEYLEYLKADAVALSHHSAGTIKEKFKATFEDDIFKYEKLLRKVEYYLNCRKSGIAQVYTMYLWHKLNVKGLKLGITIDPNCFGPGLAIIHGGPIVVSPRAQIGSNCRIYPQIVIGAHDLKSHRPAPKIGNNVRIYPGAKIFGDITLADGIIVGANAVVNKSFLEPNIVLAGVPAKKINQIF